jgi:hypothetical protein
MKMAKRLSKQQREKLNEVQDILASIERDGLPNIPLSGPLPEGVNEAEALEVVRRLRKALTCCRRFSPSRMRAKPRPSSPRPRPKKKPRGQVRRK